MPNSFKSALLASAAALLATATNAADFNIPGGDLKAALDSYSRQTGVSLLYSDQAIKGARSRGVQGDIAPDEALSRILSGTGFQIRRHEGSAITIVRGDTQAEIGIGSLQIAQATPARSAVETVTVTSSKLGGADVQSIPIAITALSQEQLTATQTTSGPDLIKQVPNMTFTKTNFSGYSIQLRGIGTQAISVTTDPAVAVAFNDMPFIRNHFFEQEFFDVAQVEVLRGPQGTLYGRNATAGVVNITSAKPSDQFEAMASADIGNYKNRRLEGMINLPIVDDRLDIRLAGEWTKRDGYSFNTISNKPTDGRDLWAGRLSIGFKPSENLKTSFIWEHFSEDDDRLRSSKQLCKRDPGPETVGGYPTGNAVNDQQRQTFLNQGCLPVSLYSDEAFQVPNALALPYYGGVVGAGFGLSIGTPMNQFRGGPQDAYAGTTQSRDLRVIESARDSAYKAKSEVFLFNAEYDINPSLIVNAQTGYNNDFLFATQDYNRFNTRSGIFANWGNLVSPTGNYVCFDNGVTSYSPGGNNCAQPNRAIETGLFCDPQLGCSDRLAAQDLVKQKSWQLNQEVRVSSKFDGPLNFSVGGNFMHYETHENYYVFFNSLTMFASKTLGNWTPGNPATQDQCVDNMRPTDPQNPGSPGSFICLGWVDVNPIDKLDDKGHNYFLSQNPYVLNSYAGFGEAYYNVMQDLKLTGGLRWTQDQKHFVTIPSALLTQGYGYPITGVVDQKWQEWTGRFAANWTPDLSFTDQTLIYSSFGHGYKAGGANPPGAILTVFNRFGEIASPAHPLKFKPEFINAYELGTKNTLLDGAITFNATTFYYDYKAYQISEIVDRTSINLNFDATVKGAELEARWEAAPGLKFGFSGGYQKTRLADGSKAIDLMDRTAGRSDWVLVKPFVSQASNCVLPAYVVAEYFRPGNNIYTGLSYACGIAYNLGTDPLLYTEANPPFTPVLSPGYPGFDPVSPTATNNGAGPAPNNGAGFDKDLSGNELPNAPHFTASFTAEYSMPLTREWAATLHSDFYWQSQSWARVINDDPYDRLRGYKNVNLSLILTSQNGWQAMGYLKNVFNTTAITGTFLNSDDSGLTTNVFLTDPRLFGVRITKNW
jgi:outer membrane receptor protein involved in Fe transport